EKQRDASGVPRVEGEVPRLLGLQPRGAEGRRAALSALPIIDGSERSETVHAPFLGRPRRPCWPARALSWLVVPARLVVFFWLHHGRAAQYDAEAPSARAAGGGTHQGHHDDGEPGQIVGGADRAHQAW